MSGNRRVWRRPYFFEILTAANLLVFVVMMRGNLYALLTLPTTLRSFVITIGGYAVGGVLVRIAIAWYRGSLRAYLRILRSPGWLVDTARFIVFGAVMVHTYFWIKLLVPLMHPGLYDQTLWDLDQAMLFGHSPNILALDLLSNHVALQVVDWAYARIFFISMTVAFAFFLSSPSRRLRAAFSTGNTLLWLIGAWLYMLVPSLGPAFGFPAIWLAHSDSLRLTQHFQALLMKNYHAVHRLPAGGSISDVQLMFGIAAFPSLHVAFQTFVFFWMRRLWIYGEIVFGVFAAVILLGSLVTGWHYLIDGIAGIAMAALCYRIAVWMWRPGEQRA